MCRRGFSAVSCICVLDLSAGFIVGVRGSAVFGCVRSDKTEAKTVKTVLLLFRSDKTVLLLF